MLLTQLLKASFQSQRMQEHSVHDTENRAVRADAERQREHGNESKAGTARFDKTRRLNRLEQFSSCMNLHLYKGCEIKVAFDVTVYLHLKFEIPLQHNEAIASAKRRGASASRFRNNAGSISSNSISHSLPSTSTASTLAKSSRSGIKATMC